MRFLERFAPEHGDHGPARDAAGGARVFVKRVPPLSNRVSPAFQREMAVLSTVHHPRIAELVASEVLPDGTGLIATMLVEGPSLRERLAEGALPVNEASARAAEVLEALEALDSNGFVHGDLKPENVVGGVLVDFGLAVKVGESWHEEGAGTPAYMAPEQVRRERVDARTDLYALGALLYELLTGLPAFVADTEARVRQRQLTSMPAPPAVVNFDVPDELSELALALLAKHPERRPDARAVAGILEKFR